MILSLKIVPIAFLAGAVTLHAQAPGTAGRDTLAIYKKIKKVAYRNKLTTLIFQSIFVDPAPRPYQTKPLGSEQKAADPDFLFANRTIRKIRITVYDPFGYSVDDTLKRDVHLMQRFANKYHITTRKRIIKNYLLLHEHDSLSLLKLRESERLIRESPYVNDVRIYIYPAGKDSVDLAVVVKDKWTVIAYGDASPSQVNLTLADKNILGSGQLYRQYVRFDRSGNYEFSGRHSVANISNTFIASDIFYTAKNISTAAGFSLERPLYSSLTKWAGGIAASRTWTAQELPAAEGTRSYPVANYDADVWLGRNFLLHQTNLVLSARSIRKDYDTRPPFTIDTNHVNSNTLTHLASIGFFRNKYYKDNFIFRFGANEDIPEGWFMQLTAGLVQQELKPNTGYAGLDIARGRHVQQAGYFSLRTAAGSFFGKHPFSININCSLSFFSDLVIIRKWYFRQFVYLKYITGVNKPAGATTRIRPDELYGRQDQVPGRSKTILNLESVAYTPYNLVGFRFAPVVLIGLGLTGTGAYTALYQSYALGLLLRNENLLASSFEVTFGYYPDAGGRNLRYNPVTNITVHVRSFFASKPSVIGYD